jgi:hypothetical protein
VNVDSILSLGCAGQQQAVQLSEGANEGTSLHQIKIGIKAHFNVENIDEEVW